MKNILFVLSLTISMGLIAQNKIAIDDLEKLKKFEVGLNNLGEKYTQDTNQDLRQKMIYRFVVTLKEALKIENSFQYPFDEVQYMDVVESPDKKFRVFTMQLTLDNQTCRHFGAIQLNSPKLKLVKLYDLSDTFSLYPTFPTTNKNWFGQLYYDIQVKKVGKKTYYFMFGYDQNDLWSKKKIIEPMYFINDTTVGFGAPLFEKYTKGEYGVRDKKEILQRFVLEYKKDASVTLSYKKEYNAIAFDHTHPEDEKLEGLHFGYIPDGTYEAFIWKKNKWNWVEKFKINDDPSMETAPIPSPQEKSGRMK